MLKQLLQQLLNTRTTPGGAAHSASSTYTSPQWFNGTSTVGDKWTNGLYTGTAPNDGYLNISGSAYITTENVGSMIQAQIGDGQISQVSPMSGQGFNMLFPISKGASFSVNGIRLTDITVRFFKTIGGGYNLLVWRALSCLRALSNFSQRSFCKVKSLGFLNSVLRLSAMAQTFLAQAPRTSLAMLHRATAGRLLGAIQAQSQLLKFKSIMGKWHLLPSSTETPLGVVSAVTSKKEPLLNSYAEAETHRIIPFGSTKQVQTLNLLSTGGALC